MSDDIRFQMGCTYRLECPSSAPPLSIDRLRVAFAMQDDAFIRHLPKDMHLEYAAYAAARFDNYCKWVRAMPSLGEVTTATVSVFNGYGSICLETAFGERLHINVSGAVGNHPLLASLTVCGLSADLHRTERVMVRHAEGVECEAPAPPSTSRSFFSRAIQAIRRCFR